MAEVSSSFTSFTILSVNTFIHILSLFSFPTPFRSFSAPNPVWASVNSRYSTFYVLYPIGVGAEFWTTMSAVKEAYAWNPLYAMFMIAVFVGYIPGKPLAASNQSLEQRS